MSYIGSGRAFAGGIISSYSKNVNCCEFLPNFAPCIVMLRIRVIRGYYEGKSGTDIS